MNRNRNLQIVDMSIMTIPSSNDCTPPSTNWMNGETTVPTTVVGFYVPGKKGSTQVYNCKPVVHLHPNILNGIPSYQSK